ncbi:hypothetical protein LguiB_026987 [Lonicera macranthoides]
MMVAPSKAAQLLFQAPVSYRQADVGTWDEASKMRKMMRHGGLKKDPEIYEKLNVLIDVMKWVDSVPDNDYMIDDDDTTDGQQVLFY